MPCILFWPVILLGCRTHNGSLLVTLILTLHSLLLSSSESVITGSTKPFEMVV